VQDFYRVAIEDRGDQVCAKADIRQKRKDCSQLKMCSERDGFHCLV